MLYTSWKIFILVLFLFVSISVNVQDAFCMVIKRLLESMMNYPPNASSYASSWLWRRRPDCPGHILYHLVFTIIYFFFIFSTHKHVCHFVFYIFFLLSPFLLILIFISVCCSMHIKFYDIMVLFLFLMYIYINR